MWDTFTPVSGLFQVSLPSPPKYGNDSILIPGTEIKRRFDVYASEQVDGTLFLISMITYPLDYDVSSSSDILRQNINELVEHKKDNHLIGISEKTIEKRPSFDFIFENQEMKVEGVGVHDDHLVYMLSYISKRDDFDSEEFKHFVDSFKILKPSKDVLKQKS